MALVLLTQPLAKVAVLFGPWENFALVTTALVLIASLSRGSFLKGMIAALLGVLLAMPGVDETSGLVRLTFGVDALTNGFQLLPVWSGCSRSRRSSPTPLHIEQSTDGVRANMKGIVLSVRDYVVHGWNMLRSSLIGIWIGILPGVGATVASIAATPRRRASRRRRAVRHRQRGSDRRGGKRQQRHHRRHADPRSWLWASRAASRMPCCLQP